jgi:hypothetical protein
VRFAKISKSKAKNGNGYKLQKFLQSIKQTDTKNYEKKTQNREHSNVARRATPEKQTRRQTIDAPALRRLNEGGKGRGMDEHRQQRPDECHPRINGYHVHALG